MDRITNHQRIPMIPVSFREPVVRKDMDTDISAKNFPKDTVFLENRKEIKPNTIYEKGIFVDLYV